MVEHSQPKTCHKTYPPPLLEHTNKSCSSNNKNNPIYPMIPIIHPLLNHSNKTWLSNIQSYTKPIQCIQSCNNMTISNSCLQDKTQSSNHEQSQIYLLTPNSDGYHVGLSSKGKILGMILRYSPPKHDTTR